MSQLEGFAQAAALVADENLAKAANQLRRSADSSRRDEKIHPSSWCRHWHRPCRRELRESQRSLLRNSHDGCGSRFRWKWSQGQARSVAEHFWPGRQSRSLVSRTGSGWVFANGLPALRAILTANNAHLSPERQPGASGHDSKTFQQILTHFERDLRVQPA
jgi:hypothetical protein